MNGPEHYAEAERLRGRAVEAQNHAYDAYGDDLRTKSWHNAEYYNAAAQVHATLALVAAVADVRMTDFNSLVEREDLPNTWADVIRSTIGGES